MNEANIERVNNPNRLPPQANKSRFVLNDDQIKKKRGGYDSYGYKSDEELE